MISPQMFKHLVSIFAMLLLSVAEIFAGGKYVLVTSVDDLEIGAKVIIVSRDSLLAMSTEQSGRGRGQTNITFEDDAKTIISDLQLPIQQLEIVTGSKQDSYALSFGDSFLNCPSGNYLNFIKQKQNSSSVKISITDLGIATIEFQRTSESSRFLKYNGSTTFSCYTKGHQGDISLFRYVEELPNFSISSVGYATYFTDHAFIMPEGVEGGIITAVDGQSLSIDYRYVAGDVVPAETGLLLRGEQGVYRYNTTQRDLVAPAENMLTGLLVDGETTAEGDVLYYKLANDATDGLGFYWGAADGGAFSIAANKAYLVVPKAMGARGFSLRDITTTGITNVAQRPLQKGIFDLHGRCINVTDVNLLKQGVYIVNGKKMIVR